MTEQDQSTVKSTQHRALILISAGIILVILSGAGLYLLPAPPQAVAVSDTPELTPSRPPITATLVDQPLVQRQLIQPPTRDVPPTPTASPTLEAEIVTVTPSPVPPTGQEQSAVDSQPTPEGTPIAFSTEERNALSWMCYYEVGGMGAVKYDACLSVISTVRARFVYGSGMGTDVISVLTRPNQFNIPIITDRPHDTFASTVDQYANGARGSCNAFLYFDSVSGGPSLCVIYGFESFIEFHNGWG